MQKSWITALLLIFFSTSALAQNKSSDTITIHGYGLGSAKSCAAFIRETDEKDIGKAIMYGDKLLYPKRQLYVEWLSGFLTAYSWMNDRQNITGDRDANDLLSWIYSYCEKHPLDSFLAATDALFLELKRKK